MNITINLYYLVTVLLLVALCQASDVKSGLGKHVSRIIQGWPAKEHQFPHQAHILFVSNTGGFSECSGSIISNTYVLTAAQCTDRKLWAIVRLGNANMTTPGVVLQCNKFIRHPNYDEYSWNNDLALINLDRFVPTSETIKPVRLPRMSEIFTSFENETATVSGWGYTADGGPSSETLNYVELSVISNQKCRIFYNPTIIKNFTLCAIGKEKETQGTCLRDTGGPLTIVEEDGELTQIGITSFAAGYSSAECASKVPSGYTRTSYYVQWIQTMSGIPARP